MGIRIAMKNACTTKNVNVNSETLLYTYEKLLCFEMRPKVIANITGEENNRKYHRIFVRGFRVHTKLKLDRSGEILFAKNGSSNRNNMVSAGNMIDTIMSFVLMPSTIKKESLIKVGVDSKANIQSVTSNTDSFCLWFNTKFPCDSNIKECIFVHSPWDQ